MNRLPIKYKEFQGEPAYIVGPEFGIRSSSSSICPSFGRSWAYDGWPQTRVVRRFPMGRRVEMVTGIVTML